MKRMQPGFRRSAGAAALVLVGAGLAAPFLPSGPMIGQAVAEPSGDAAPGAYTVDAVHSSVIYRIKHMDVAYHYGRFNDFAGTFLLNADSPADSSVEITIQTASIDSGNGGRDKHLRSPDFFNVEQFPTATFSSTSVRKTGDTTYEVTGDFTLNGTTKPITVTINNTGEGQGRGGVEIAGFETTFTFNRLDYGLGRPGGVGEDVRLTVSCEGARK